MSSAHKLDILRLPLLALLAPSCADVLDLPSDPRVQPSGPWRCLSAPAVPTPPAEATARVRLQACDFISDCTERVTGLNAQLCDKLDVGCANPRQVGIVDDDGELTLDVPTDSNGFDGYVQIIPPFARCNDTSVFGSAANGLLCSLAPGCDPSAPTDVCNIPTYSPVLWFFNPPVIASFADPMPLPLYPSAALPAVVEAAGGSLDPAGGSVFVTVLDCDGVPASGVSLSLAEHQVEAQSLYFDSGVISNTATATDATGIGGFIRVPPGFVELQAVNDDDVDIARVGLQSVPSFLTYAFLVPSPM
jgi:hypothetical protein